MPNSKADTLSAVLKPKQPEFVLATSDYQKKVIMKNNIAHFYQFTAESNKLEVIPDACIDILFWKKDGRIVTKIAGTVLEKAESNAELNSECFGVRLMPGINPVYKALPLYEIVNKEWEFASMLPHDEKEKLLENLFFSNTLEEKIKIFMNYFIHQADPKTEDSLSLKNYLRNEIINSDGDLKLSDLSLKTGYSERYLNKRIHEDFGMNPKNLIRIIRFQKAVDNLTATIGNTNCIHTALDHGYYDQSHFIKDFKRLSGTTPIGYINNLLSNSYNQKLHVIQ